MMAARRSTCAPRRHALFYGCIPELYPVPHLVKRSHAPLALLAASVSALTGHDRCRIFGGHA